MPKLINVEIGSGLLSNEMILSYILAIWLLLYCSQKDISGLKSAALWGVFGIIFFLILNVVDLFYLSYYEMLNEDRHIKFLHIDFEFLDGFNSIACILLSFSFHTYAFSIYECLDTPDPKKMIVTSSVGIFISMLIYQLVGSIDYIIYGNLITDSILDNLEYSSLSVLGNISFVINVVMSFPLTFSALKHYLIYLIETILSMLIYCCKRGKSKTEKKVLFDDEFEVKGKIRKNDSQDSINNDHLVHSIEGEKHHKNHVSIPESIEYVIMLAIFILIFFTAKNFPDMKIVFYILI
jgi:amino acid permease